MVWDRFVAFPKIAARVHYGLASTMLGQLPVGGCVPGIVRTLQSDFHLPDDKSAPSIATREHEKKYGISHKEMERPGDEHQPSDESWEGTCILWRVCFPLLLEAQ